MRKKIVVRGSSLENFKRRMSLLLLLILSLLITIKVIRPYESQITSVENENLKFSLVSVSQRLIGDTIIQLRAFSKSRGVEVFRCNLLNLDCSSDISLYEPLVLLLLDNKSKVKVNMGGLSRVYCVNQFYLE